jgi:hypothetical protein
MQIPHAICRSHITIKNDVQPYGPRGRIVFTLVRPIVAGCNDFSILLVEARFPRQPVCQAVVNVSFRSGSTRCVQLNEKEANDC